MTARSLWSGEWCKRGDHAVTFGFSVSDADWQLVIGDRWNVVCAPCFDAEAQDRGVAYRLLAVWPVQWHGSVAHGAIERLSAVHVGVIT